MNINIHHLELFYYVARYGGIMEAVRNIPYGIQQPAVSGQVAQLEEHLGLVLFQRRPFALTAGGEKLYRFVEPFFSNIPKIEAELRGDKTRPIRIGASTTVLRDHLPGLFQNVRKKFPDLKIGLREAYHAELESLLQNEELDLAVTLIEKKSIAGIHAEELIQLELVLVVEKNSRITDAEQLWKMDKIEEPLICLPRLEALCKHFQQGLARLGVDWFPSIEVSSVDLIETYVGNGFGIGASVRMPAAKVPSNVRLIALPGFPKLTLGALWRGRKTPVIEALLHEMRERAKRLNNGFAELQAPPTSRSEHRIQL